MGLKKATVKLGADTKEFQSKMRKASKTFRKMGKQMKDMGKQMSIGLTLPLTAFAAASVKAFDTQAKAEAKLRTALKGNEKAFKSLTKQASELQKISLFGDEETIQAQSMLASMGLEEDAIKRLTPLIQDMATAKGMNLTAAADLVAKSVGSSTNALSRYGIQIEGAVGSTERLDSAANALSKQFKGQAKAAAEAGAGGITQLKNSIGDLMEEIGALLMPVINSIAEKVKGMVKKFGDLDKGTKVIILTIGILVSALGPVIYTLGIIATKIMAINTPILLVIAGIAALVTAVGYAASNWDALSERANLVFTILQNDLLDLAKFFVKNNPISILIKGYNKVAKFFGKEQLGNPFENIGNSLDKFKKDLPQVKTQMKGFGESMRESALKAAGALGFLNEQVSGGSEGGGSEGGAESGGGDTGIIQNINKLKEASNSFAMSISESFASGFANAVTSGEGFLKSMTEIFKGIAKQIAAMIIKALVLAALFQFTGLGNMQAAAGGATGFKDLLALGLQGKATGGSVSRNTPYMVGEKGPEMFMPNSSGTIIPNHKLSGGAGDAVIPDVRISGNDLLIVFDRAERRKNRR